MKSGHLIKCASYLFSCTHYCFTFKLIQLSGCIHPTLGWLGSLSAPVIRRYQLRYLFYGGRFNHLQPVSQIIHQNLPAGNRRFINFSIPPVWAVTHSSSVWLCPDPDATFSHTLDKVKDLNSHVP